MDKKTREKFIKYVLQTENDARQHKLCGRSRAQRHNPYPMRSMADPDMVDPLPSPSLGQRVRPMKKENASQTNTTPHPPKQKNTTPQPPKQKSTQKRNSTQHVYQMHSSAAGQVDYSYNPLMVVPGRSQYSYVPTPNLVPQRTLKKANVSQTNTTPQSPKQKNTKPQSAKQNNSQQRNSTQHVYQMQSSAAAQVDYPYNSLMVVPGPSQYSYVPPPNLGQYAPQRTMKKGNASQTNAPHVYQMHSSAAPQMGYPRNPQIVSPRTTMYSYVLTPNLGQHEPLLPIKYENTTTNTTPSPPTQEIVPQTNTTRISDARNGSAASGYFVPPPNGRHTSFDIYVTLAIPPTIPK